ncbi:hypothetical protein CHLRE_12g506850v5 [Chlamydomonas reinhardtii]|uniref:EF-hand domain-containing protein n=1 Tax=Chlamydomonas reinhardtii TaxID=3055 RepID=A0A2K3D2V9_CHLRE|nr:uncharacterized protein CHLRE_12g506850v5 [Chlamydomonas reinhardtii]PNW74871.1 hypothetical protein CHLRE_12g506850v5 [Chlamydomonas reinhardtii]
MWPLTRNRHQQQQPQQQQPQPVAQEAKRPDLASLRQWFDKVDTDLSGHITAPELQAALMQGGLNLSLGTVGCIIRQVDRDGTGTVSLQEFERLHEFLASVEESFTQLKSDPATGRVSLPEVAVGLKSYGYDLDAAVQRALFNRFDPTRSGSMGLQEFLALTLFLRSANATFKAFDPANTGTVHLNYAQFLYAAVNSN